MSGDEEDVFASLLGTGPPPPPPRPAHHRVWLSDTVAAAALPAGPPPPPAAVPAVHDAAAAAAGEARPRTGGPRRREGLPRQMRDAPIPRAPAPAPPPVPPPAGVLPATDFVPYPDIREHRARERAAYLQRLAQRAGDAAADGQADCFLCSRGVRSAAAGEGGMLLFAELVRIVGQLWAVRSPEWLTGLVLRFFDKWMRPRFESAGAAVPEVRYEAVYEHLSTTRHTKNPVVMQITMINDINDEILDLSSSMRVRDGSTDARILAQIANRRKAIVDIYGMDMQRAAFRDAGIDGDIAPAVIGYLSPALAVTDLRPHLSAPVYNWLLDEVAPAIAPPAPPAAPPHPADRWDT